MDYAGIKLIHQSAVVLSGLGFAARSWASLCSAQWVRGRVAKTLPHVVDSILLASALSMAWMMELNPLRHAWLMAKIMGLLVYIALGMVALRPQHPIALRATAAACALGVLVWIASVALLKSAWGFL